MVSGYRVCYCHKLCEWDGISSCSERAVLKVNLKNVTVSNILFSTITPRASLISYQKYLKIVEAFLPCNTFPFLFLGLLYKKG